MYFQVEDRFRKRDSFLHRLDPRAKVVIALGLILTLSLLPIGAFARYAAVWLAVLAGAAWARVGPGYVLARSFVALPFVLAVVTLPFTTPGEIIARAPWLGWPVTLEGTLRAASIVAKSWVSVQVAILLVAITSLPDLLWGLRALRVPAPLIAIVSFMYRYLFVLAEETQRLLRARAARSAARGGRR
ncbi:MAG TPA: energy-coupling factor transporter transmembrane component T, partial [Caldilineaceae bacterium]|nr:energy-coupling factor transporter transmembrane component T [Caldilineaceae bacterium]